MAEQGAQKLASQLAGSFNPAAAMDFDGTVLLELQPESAATPAWVRLIVNHGQLDVSVVNEPTTADITLFFHSGEEAAELLLGRANPVNAFMDGRFRSDGYLIWVFAVLSMFRAV